MNSDLHGSSIPEEFLCQKRQLEDQGGWIGVRLEKAAAGKASQKARTDYKYARLRSGKGKLLDNGKRSLYVSFQDIPGIEAQIQRGRQLKQVEREIGVSFQCSPSLPRD